METLSQRDWSREQLADPVCSATITYVGRSCPSPFPLDVLRETLDSFGVRAAPTKDEVLELASKVAVAHVTTDDGDTVPLLVRKPTQGSNRPTGRVASLLNDEPIRIFVPTLLRPLVLQRCHASVSCHLGVSRTLRMLERFYFWIGMEQCVRWWIRRCFMCQARKSPRMCVHWPVINIPLPDGPGEAISLDYFGPLPTTSDGNKYILLITDRFSRRASMYAVCAAQFTAVGTADIVVNDYIPKWGCPKSLLSDNGRQFCSELSSAVCRMMGIRKLTTSAYHAMGNGGTERVNRTMAQMLSMVVNDRQDDWDKRLPHVESAYNNSVSAATGLAPNEVHLGRLPRLPLTVIERRGARGHQGLERDQVEYCDLARDRQRLAYQLVREHHVIESSRIARANQALSDVFHKRPLYTVGCWVWVYNSKLAVRQSIGDEDERERVLKSKLSLNWSGPFKVLRVGPCASAPDGQPVGEKLLYLELPPGLRGPSAKRRVSVMRCKPCVNPHDTEDRPRHLPAGFTEYVLASVSEKSPPFHVTDDDVESTLDVERLELDVIVAHQFIRGWGGRISVLYETRWVGLSSTSWEREADLQRSRRSILAYWTGNPIQCGGLSHQRYLRSRQGAALREIHRERGERFVAKGYGLVSRKQYLRTFSDPKKLRGAHLWYKDKDSHWWLGIIHTVGSTREPFVIRFLDDPGPVRLILRPELYSTDATAARFSWCLQRRKSGGILDGVRHAAHAFA